MAIPNQRKVSRAIYSIFTKKYGLHIQPDASRYLEELLRDDENINDAVERIVKMYQKRNEGVSKVIVDKTTVQDVVEAMQAAAVAATNITPFSTQDELLKEDLSQMTLDDEPDNIDVSQYLHVVDAFSMPAMQYDYHRKGFVKSREKRSLLASADAKGDVYRDRFNLIRQRVLRNENFLPPSLQIIDNDSYLKITPIKSLIGHDDEQFLLLGMLTQIEEGKLFLEDNDAYVELDLSRCKSTIGLFTDNCFILVEGVYGDDHIFHVDELGLPPPESRAKTTSVFGHIDFLGLPPLNIEETVLLKEEQSNINISFVIISDLWLDQPKVFRAFRKLLEGYSESIVPLAFILMGNFVSQPLLFSGAESAKYKESFNLLADMIAEFPKLASHSYFIFVPGANDPWAGNTLPRPPIPDFFTSRLRQKVKRAIFTSNPSRIQYCTQEIVIFREDLLNRLRRNVLIQGDSTQDDHDLTKPLIRTIVDQAHLCPLPLAIRPIYCAYDHALRLYPMPDMLILADRCDNYSTTYEGCHCINPGSFPNSDFNWTTYYPAIRDSERCIMEDETNPELDQLFEDDPGSLAEIGEEDVDDLDIANVGTKIWLVKVPNFLAEKWKNVDQDSMNLGTVRIYNRQVKLILPDNEMTSDIPKEYSIKIPSGEVENKYVFAGNQHGAATRVVGKIHHECHVSPANWKTYRDIMRKRVHEADRPTRSVQILGQSSQPVFAPGASSGMPVSDFSSFIPSKKPRIDKEKATRMPRNELMDMLFAAFERYPYWSLKGIVEHTRQPMQYLKEILSEICILNKRGPYTSMYQLKAEYKVRGADNRPKTEGTSEGAGGDGSEGDFSSDDEEDEEDMEMVQ